MSRLPARRFAALAVGLLAAAAVAAPISAQAQEAIETGPGGSGAPPAALPGPAAGEAPTAPPAGALRDAGALRAYDAEQSPEAIGEWGRRVLAGEPAPREQAAATPADGGPNGQKASGCAPPPDNKPHGEVWAGAGTGGYRNVGGVVTQPIGSCGSVTLMIDQSQSNYRWRR